jgi:catechol 2,3-dioxygenase-like lactoylglutathione lyase family enzyme
MKGGAGFEIWQYTSRKTQAANFVIQPGDYGLFCVRMKTSNLKASFENFKAKKINLVSEIVKNPYGVEHFFLKDPYGNLFDVLEDNDWFGKGKQLTGGANGCMIGVSDPDRSKNFYSKILGYDKVIYDKEGVFDDLKNLPSGSLRYRRILIAHSKPRTGSFSKLLGSSYIELIKALDRSPRKIFENRYWGDLGFIHLCFDVNGMDQIQKECVATGHPFTVDSANSFDMGEAAGRFSYAEDPDGTLIEFVETHKIPILKKIGLYLNLKNRKPEKRLPNWMLKMLALNRVSE